MYGFESFGVCVKCGDTQGPWSWYKKFGWLCERCEEELKQWKKLCEVKPKLYSDLIFVDTDGIQYTGTFDRLNRFISRNGEHIENVVAWMEAPEPFEE